MEERVEIEWDPEAIVAQDDELALPEPKRKKTRSRSESIVSVLSDPNPELDDLMAEFGLDEPENIEAQLAELALDGKLAVETLAEKPEWRNSVTTVDELDELELLTGVSVSEAIIEDELEALMALQSSQISHTHNGNDSASPPLTSYETMNEDEMFSMLNDILGEEIV